MQALRTIGWAKRTGVSTADGYRGVPIYAPAVDMPVYGWHPGGSGSGQASSKVVNGEETTLRVVSSLVVLVPDTSPYSPADKVTIGDKDYLITGEPADVTTGPFSYAPGGTITVERVSG